MHIGIFDTGTGGRLVGERLRHLLPHHTYTVVNDLTHAPYGDRPEEEIITLTHAAIQPLLSCDIIILACNTATTVAIDTLRQRYPQLTFIGFEPMIKPASRLTRTGRVTLLATAATKRSQRLQKLIDQYGAGLIIDTPDTIGWAKHIDQDHPEMIALDGVAASVARGSDIIILGCTHYLALTKRLNRAFPRCTILEPSKAIARMIETYSAATAATNCSPRSA